jgi:RNA polymerase sigma factor (sigma-70 family)
MTVVYDRADVDAEVIKGSEQDPERFGAIFDSYLTEIHGYVAKRLGPSNAEDVVAETFLIAFRKRHLYNRSRGSVRTWLYGIVTHLIERHHRAEVRLLRAVSRAARHVVAEEHAEQVTTRVCAEATRVQLSKALADLSPGDRSVVLLVALAGLSHDEIASALDIPYGTVGSRLSRARKRLRAALGDTNPMLDEGVDK